MEEKREAEVWQRVTGQLQPQQQRNLDVLMRESMDLAAVYRRLAENQTGRGKILARKLLETERANADALRGVGILSEEYREGIKLWGPASGSGKRMLETCFHRTRRCQAEYTARSLDPEFGEVFRELAQRAGKQCIWIAELLGWMK